MDIEGWSKPPAQQTGALRPRRPDMRSVVTPERPRQPPAEDEDEKHLHDTRFRSAVGPTEAMPTGTRRPAEAIIKEAEAETRLVAITAAMPGPPV